MVAGQNLHSLTSSLEFVHQHMQNPNMVIQHLKEGLQQLKEEIAILKDKLETKELKAHLAILEGKLHLQHRNTPSCPLPSDSASLSQPNLETTAVSWQPVSPEAPANRAETDVSPKSAHSAFLADVRPTSLSGSTSTKGPPPVATLIYTLTALMARFWPTTLPPSDESSHCLDTG